MIKRLNKYSQIWLIQSVYVQSFTSIYLYTQ